MADISIQGLITAALTLNGVVAAGTAPQAADSATALVQLNVMLGSWQRKRWLTYRLADVAAISTGAARYTVGPGGTFALGVRPDQIYAPYARLLGNAQPATDNETAPGTDTPGNIGFGGGQTPIDFPLTLIESRQEWASISFKGLQTYPVAAFYDPDYPNGWLYLWPAPTAQLWELHFLVKEVMPSSFALGDMLGLPAEYQEAVLYNLAMRVRPSYGQEPDPVIGQLAMGSLQTIRSVNTMVPRLAPCVPSGRGGGVYWPALEGSNAALGGLWDGFAWDRGVPWG